MSAALMFSYCSLAVRSVSVPVSLLAPRPSLPLLPLSVQLNRKRTGEREGHVFFCFFKICRFPSSDPVTVQDSPAEVHLVSFLIVLRAWPISWTCQFVLAAQIKFASSPSSVKASHLSLDNQTWQPPCRGERLSER